MLKYLIITLVCWDVFREAQSATLFTPMIQETTDWPDFFYTTEQAPLDAVEMFTESAFEESTANPESDILTTASGSGESEENERSLVIAVHEEDEDGISGFEELLESTTGSFTDGETGDSIAAIIETNENVDAEHFGEDGGSEVDDGVIRRFFLKLRENDGSGYEGSSEEDVDADPVNHGLEWEIPTIRQSNTDDLASTTINSMVTKEYEKETESGSTPVETEDPEVARVGAVSISATSVDNNHTEGGNATTEQVEDSTESSGSAEDQTTSTIMVEVFVFTTEKNDVEESSTAAEVTLLDAGTLINEQQQNVSSTKNSSLDEVLPRSRRADVYGSRYKIKNSFEENNNVSVDDVNGLFSAQPRFDWNWDPSSGNVSGAGGAAGARGPGEVNKSDKPGGPGALVLKAKPAPTPAKVKEFPLVLKRLRRGLKSGPRGPRGSRIRRRCAGPRCGLRPEY
ncbi:unnamed protein product [Clavelina lepadiformis]|uniref:Uncharacterized protein n=1 Tax=Clavelina lepadiformis TaxID=159417 RepID=A0ABP0EZR3_CLALP